MSKKSKKKKALDQAKVSQVNQAQENVLQENALPEKTKQEKVAHESTTQEKPSFIKVLLSLILAVALVAMILLNIFTYVFSVVQYYGDSMEPAISDRQVLVVLKTDNITRGDVTAFYFNNKVLVRRVIAEGGSTVDIDSTGNVYLDANIFDEPYVSNPTLGQSNIDFPFTVPYDEYFMMGDNRAVSMDSRLKELGTVPRNRILGKVVLVLG